MKRGKSKTRRWQSSSPNLQNIPIRTVEGQEIKKSFGLYETHFFDSGDRNEISKSGNTVFQEV